MGAAMFGGVVAAIAVVAVVATIRDRRRRRALLAYVAELERHPELASTAIDGLDHAREIARGTLPADRDPTQSSTAIIVGNRHGRF